MRSSLSVRTIFSVYLVFSVSIASHRGTEPCYGGRSSVGRAPDCDSGGRGFEPHRPPHILGNTFSIPLRKAFALRFLCHLLRLCLVERAIAV